MMKNISTKDFCRKFDACREGTRFALKFSTMRYCYAALLAEEAGDNSASWAIWVVTQPGVMSDRDLRLFAVRCARRVQNHMVDERSISALDVAERYVNGEATDAELSTARASAWAARSAAWNSAGISWDAARAASAAAWTVVRDAAAGAAVWAASADGRRAQLDILKEFGNPFEEK